MILTREMLQEAGISEVAIEILGERANGDVELTPNALMRVHDAGLELEYFDRFIPWNRAPSMKKALEEASLQYGYLLRQQRVIRDRAYSRYQECRAALMCFLLEHTPDQHCGDSHTKPPPLTKEFVGDSIRATERILDEVFDKNAAGAYPQRDRETIRDALEALRVAILALEDIKDLTKECNDDTN